MELVQKDFFKTYSLGVILKKKCRKVIKNPFRHEMHYIKIMLLNKKISCELLKLFLLRVLANFYGNRNGNKKLEIE